MKVFDLFCGCGGLSLGFQQAKFDVIAAYDNWSEAIDVYNRNFKKHSAQKVDLSSEYKTIIDEAIKHKVEMIIGGPPCQDFSSAGKRDEDLGKGDLSVLFATIVAKSKAPWVVMENVDRIVKSQKIKEVRKILHKAGYGISECILLASLCGVPQNRKRFFLVGHLESEDGYLDYYLQKNLSSKPMTIRDYLGNSLGIEHYYRHPRNYSRRGIFSIDEPSPTVRGVNRPVPKGYPGHDGDTMNVSKELRPLTTIERSYIQTFPKTFRLEGTKTNLEQMIGNAVPVKMAKYVGMCINEYVQDIKDNMKTHFPKKPSSACGRRRSETHRTKAHR